ncbi:MAG TPA: MerR family transcriptional regulator [Edaphobacter sp.]|nr:MerR family transcriptional regulator [Edaphobacter sp.]
MQIGKVAQSTGLSVGTIRFYEKQSLIPLAQRTDGGYRVYDESTVDRLQLIGRAQSLGVSLQEIRELLLIEDGESGGGSHVRDLIAARVEQVREKIKVKVEVLYFKGCPNHEPAVEQVRKDCGAKVSQYLLAKWR